MQCGAVAAFNYLVGWLVRSFIRHMSCCADILCYLSMVIIVTLNVLFFTTPWKETSGHSAGFEHHGKLLLKVLTKNLFIVMFFSDCLLYRVMFCFVQNFSMMLINLMLLQKCKKHLTGMDALL